MTSIRYHRKADNRVMQLKISFVVGNLFLSKTHLDILEMLNSDDFDQLFDEYKKTKKSKPLKSVGMSKVEKLPIWKDVKTQDNDYECLVCRQDIDDEDIVEACTNCQRYFHYSHIREWLRIKAICPNCKTKL